MKIDKEVSHPFHPQHKLKPEFTETPFNCDGCKEAGIGLKHKCQQCDQFDLHKACALAPPTITHTFYKKCEFQFFHHPPGPTLRICDACGNDVLGFVYHCKRCGFDLHPCCADLPRVLNDGERNLYLCLKLSNSCYCCGGKGGPGWCYMSKCKNYNIHVSCVKKLLLENWQAMNLKVDSNKVRELQTRIPSLGGSTTSRDHHGGGRRGGGGGGGGGGKASKFSQMATGAISAIVSAILGDPTAVIAAAVGALLFK